MSSSEQGEPVPSTALTAYFLQACSLYGNTNNFADAASKRYKILPQSSPPNLKFSPNA
jgi:hypothetical protein